MFVWIFLFLLFLPYRGKFGFVFGENAYLLDGCILQLPFPTSFDLVVETKDIYFFPLLYFFSFWMGIMKKELWTVKDNNRLHYHYRGRTTRANYIPSHPVRLRRGQLLIQEGRRSKSYTPIGKKYPLTDFPCYLCDISKSN